MKASSLKFSGFCNFLSNFFHLIFPLIKHFNGLHAKETNSYTFYFWVRGSKRWSRKMTMLCRSARGGEPRTWCGRWRKSSRKRSIYCAGAAHCAQHQSMMINFKDFPSQALFDWAAEKLSDVHAMPAGADATVHRRHLLCSEVLLLSHATAAPPLPSLHTLPGK